MVLLGPPLGILTRIYSLRNLAAIRANASASRTPAPGLAFQS